MELEELRGKIKDNRIVPNDGIGVLHYTKNFMRIVESDTFKLSDFLESNDKRESFVRLNKREQIDAYRYISTTSYKDPMKNIYSYRNPVLWMYYAGNYDGVAFNIDVNSIINDYKDHIVNYGYIEYIRGIHDDLTTEEYLMCKSEEWEYEQEYRIIFKDIMEIKGIKKYINRVFFGFDCKSDFKRKIKDNLENAEFHDTDFDILDGRINCYPPLQNPYNI